jgi:hypothetical protein
MQSSAQHSSVLETQSISLDREPKHDDQILDCVLMVMASLMLITAMSFVIWGLNRGLDIRDEGFYLLMTSSPQEYVSSTSFHFFLSKLPDITGSLIINLRLFQLISQLVSNVVLGWGFWRLMSMAWLKPTKIQLCTSMIVTVLASFLLQAIFPPDISYNGLTYFCIFSSFGLVFAGSSFAQNRWHLGKYLIALAGFLCGLVFFIKFPACITSVAITSLWFIANRDKRRLWLYYLLGLIISPIVFFCLFENPLQYKEQVLETIRLASIVPTFSLKTVIHTYVHDFVSTTSIIWQNLRFYLFVPLIAGILHVYMIKKTKSAVMKSVSRLFPVVCIAPGVFALQPSDWLLMCLYPVVYAALISYLFVVVVFLVANLNRVTAQIGRPSWLAFSSIMVLFLAPFACSIGTSNPILLQVTTCLSPIFLALTALSIRAFPDFCSSAYRLVLTGGVSLLVLALFLYGYVYHPYLLCDNLINQKCDSDNLENLRGIKLGQEAHECLTSISTLLKKGGFCPGDPIMALYNMPGIVYAVSGTAPYEAWLFSMREFEKYRPIWFQGIRSKVKSRLFIITSWEPALRTQESMQKAGIDFPNNFQLIGTTQMKPYLDGCGTLNWGAGDRYLGGEVRVYKWKQP